MLDSLGVKFAGGKLQAEQCGPALGTEVSGFSFTAGREPKRQIAPKAILRFKEKLRELTGRTRGVKVERMAEALGRYLRGWVGYIGNSQRPSVLDELERWLRRRLRSVIRKLRRVGSCKNCGSGA